MQVSRVCYEFATKLTMCNSFTIYMSIKELNSLLGCAQCLQMGIGTVVQLFWCAQIENTIFKITQLFSANVIETCNLDSFVVFNVSGTTKDNSKIIEYLYSNKKASEILAIKDRLDKK